MKLFLVVFVIFANGCRTIGSERLNEERKLISQAHVGCPKDEITLSDQSDYNWTVSCRGKTFFCNVIVSHDYSPSQNKCTEEIKRQK